MKIEYVNHSIGNNYGEEIELNENLKKYPKLHRKILRHELGHTNKGFKKNFIHDLTEDSVGIKEILSFMLHNPKSFYQFRPFFWHKKYGFTYDSNLIIIYSVILIVITTAILIS